MHGAEPEPASPPSRPNRWLPSRLLPFVLIAIHLELALLVLLPTPHLGGDNAIYVSLAQALLEGHGYVELFDPARAPHTQFPPVFPVVLALALAAGLEPWIQLKLVVVAFSVVALSFTYAWLRRRAGRALALAITLALALSPGVALQATWVLSDVPFWAFTAVALWALAGWRAGARGRFAVAALAILLACFTRSAGLPLALAALGWLVLRRRWYELVALLALLLPFGLWWTMRGGAESGAYLSALLAADPYDPATGGASLVDLIARVPDNARRYLQTHLPTLLVGRTGAAAQGLAALAATLAVVGWARRLRAPGVAELFAPLYLAVLLLWPPAWSGERFLLPVLPLLLLHAAIGGRLLLPRRARRPAAIAALVATAALALPAAVAATRTAADCRRALDTCLPEAAREFQILGAWARENLPDDAIVLSRKPGIFYLASGRPSRIYPLRARPTDFLTLAESIGARYVLHDRLDALTDQYLTPVILERPGAFCSMTSSGGTQLLGIVASAEEPPAPRPERVAELPLCDDSFFAERH